MSAASTVRASVVGLAAALVGSAVLALVSSVIVGFARHPLEAVPWLFAVSAVPAMGASIVIDHVGRHTPRSSKSGWVVAILSAVLVVIVAGSAGAIVVQSLRFGPSRVNWSGYLQWCGVYSVVLLPLTLPVALVATRLLWMRREPAQPRQV